MYLCLFYSTVNAKDDGGTGIVIEEAEIVDCEGKYIFIINI